MYYIIYKITNLMNNKIYIGKHQTKNINDKYFGSGKLLKNAIKKYGVDNFKKEILFIFRTENEMNDKEKELVTEEFCLRTDTYNICEGGQGGFSYINRNKLNNSKRDVAAHMKKLQEGNIGRKNPAGSKRLREWHKLGLLRHDTFKDKHHTQESKEKISKALKGRQTGELNSQYGKIWITDGIISKSILNTKEIPTGWYKGRKMPKAR